MSRPGRKSNHRVKSLPIGTERGDSEGVNRRGKMLSHSLTVLLLITVVVMGVVAIQPNWITGRSSAPITDATPVSLYPSIASLPKPAALDEYHARHDLKPQTLDELLDLPGDQLHRVDIARMNLLCASGLPGSRGLDIEHALATLDEWVKRVAFETDRHLYRVTDPRYAEHYGHSEAKLRAEMLAQVLHQDLGVKYDMNADGNFSFADLSTGFIHGMIPAPGQTTADTPGGTCVSMPVLYVAVGRRLGYPLKLVTTDSHVFARWDGEGHSNPAWRERFNCETTGGFGHYDDDYYRTWPKPVTEKQVEVNGFLQSFTPAEEMALFMATRGHHGEDVGQLGFAARCYENAHRYDTQRPSYEAWFMDAALASNYQASTPKLQHMLAVHRSNPTKAKQKKMADALGPRIPDPNDLATLPGAYPDVTMSVQHASITQPFTPPSHPTIYYDPIQTPPR